MPLMRRVKTLARRAAAKGVASGVALLPGPLRAMMAEHAPMVRRLDYGGARVLLHVDSEMEYFVRLRSASKEPETVTWIETLRPGDVLYDIGANVGAYSLIAAKRFNGTVHAYAFEPSPLNFGQLLRNLATNDCGDAVTPIPVALASTTRLETMNYSSAQVGAAMHTLGAAVDEHGRAFQPAMRQRLLVYSLDDVVKTYELAPPTHIKIDVDGGEREILQGAPETLRSPSLRSVLVETGVPGAGAEPVRKTLEQFGFALEASFPHGSRAANLIFGRAAGASAEGAS